MAGGEFSGLIPYAINFSVVAGAFVYYGRKPFQKFVYQRHERFKDLVEAASSAKKNAEARFTEIQNKIRALKETEQKIKAENENEAKEILAQVEKNTDYEIKKIEQETTRIIANEEDAVVQKVKSEILAKAIDRAKRALQKKMKKEDHSLIIRSAKKQIEVEI